ncbi:MAG TPA: FAD-dependent monooxygenase [Terriglobia bacterium]|nr:FAD-dependent monooxygenase [Terriglobia bacterium]
MLDLAIIGGGPAGTAAAIAARRHGLSVAIWERDLFPRDKVCGEFISPESLPLLRQQVPAALARGAVVRGAEFVPTSGRAYSFTFSSPACGLSRWAMDEALWHAARASGAHTLEGTAVRGVRRRNGPGAAWEIESGDGEQHLGRTLLVACGRWWSLDGFPSPARTGQNGAVGRWIGAKAHFSGVAHRDAVEMYFFPGGYCGLTPIEGSLYNACCLVHSRRVRESAVRGASDFRRWINAAARHPALRARLGGAIQVSETVTTAPVRLARRHSNHQGALLAGDAAGFLDPFTGDGISQALHAGRLAAECVATARGGEMTDMTAMTDRGSSDADPVASSYRRGLAHAVWRSYAVAGLVRALVRAPATVQSAAAAAVPFLGPRLLAATRWQEAGDGT